MTTDLAYWTNPDTITAYSTLLLMLVTGALVLATWKYVKEVRGQAKDMQDQAVAMKRQADAMEGQSSLIREQANAMTRQADTIEGQSKFVQAQSVTMQEQAKTMLEQAAAMKQQAKIMEMQSTIMLENIEYDRLAKRYDRVNKEMALFVGPMYSRRNDASLFALKKHTEKMKSAGFNNYDKAHYDFVDFWESIEKNVYLNRSNDLQRAFGNFFSNIDAYFGANDRGSQEDKTTLEGVFHKASKPHLIEQIEKRYNEIANELVGIEAELKIDDEKRKRK